MADFQCSPPLNKYCSDSDLGKCSPLKVGYIVNPRSHFNRKRDSELSLSGDVLASRPADLSDLRAELSRLALAGIDLLVISGGDGTVRDILTHGQSAFGSAWPKIALLPRGKTNALASDLRVPRGWTLADAVQAAQVGRLKTRRPISIMRTHGTDRTPLLGFVVGAGAFKEATKAGQRAHSLGAFQSLAVVLTAFWAFAQSLLATRQNKWRRGARMTINLGSDNIPLVHSGLGDPAYRQIFFASSLRTLPARINPASVHYWDTDIR